MILKFENYINELWSKSVERNMSGEKRLEDKLPPLPESVYRVNNFPDFCFILDYVTWKFIDHDDDEDIYVNIYKTPFDEDTSEMIGSIGYSFKEGKCPQFNKLYYDKNIWVNSNEDKDTIITLKSIEFIMALNETLLSLPKETWTKKYFEKE